MQNQYPYYQPPQPPRRNQTIWTTLIASIVVMVVSAVLFLMVLGGLGVFVKLASCGDAGCHESYPTPTVTAPTPDPRLFETAEVGTQLTYNGKRLLVSGMSQAQSYGKTTADTGYRLVAVNITFVDTTSSQLYMSTSDFDVTDSAGHIYTRIKDAKTPALSSQPASSPPSATGWLTFQVPEKASNLILQYNMTDSNGMKVVLQVRLGDLVGNVTVIPTAPNQ